MMSMGDNDGRLGEQAMYVGARHQCLGVKGYVSMLFITVYEKIRVVKG